MFSISTIASSTRMPITSVSASRVMMLRREAEPVITAKVGISDSGMATRDDPGRAPVAQEQPHHQQRQQRAFPEHGHRRSVIARSVSSTVEVTSWNPRPGCSFFSWSIAARTPSATLTSLEPRVRDIEKATTGSPSSEATLRGIGRAVGDRGRADSRTGGRPAARSRSRAAPARRPSVPSVRMVCCAPPSSARPPGRSAWFAPAAAITCAGGHAEGLQGARVESTRISRVDAAAGAPPAPRPARRTSPR